MLTVLPFWSGDVHLAIKNIEFAIELDGKCDFDCILAHDNKADPAPVKAIAEKYFKSVRTFTYDRPAVEKWPVPQNNAFCNVARYVHVFKKPWFWWETDSVPLKAGWLQTLWDEYKRGKKPFGGHWNYEAKIFNGVAIYPAMLAAFSQRAATADLLQVLPTAPQPQPPWDWYCSQEVLPRLHIMNHVMQHLWELDGKAITFPDQATVDRLVRPEAVLFHRSKQGDLIDRLRERRRAPSLVTKEQPIVDINTVYGKTPPKVEIVVVTYWKDAQWLDSCLASIRKYASGFAGTTVLYPSRDRETIKPVCDLYGIKASEFMESPGKGHLHQNMIKCMADMFCTADFLMHMDSDCLMVQPTTPAKLFRDGKPIHLYQRYDTLLPKNPGDITGAVWREPTQKALGWDMELEFMKCLPIIHHRKTYQDLRQWICRVHGMAFEKYVMRCKPKFPYGFCEFNALGAFAFKHLNDLYHWQDANKDGLAPMDWHVWQLWSHGGDDFKHPSFYGADQKQVRELVLNGDTNADGDNPFPRFERTFKKDSIAA